MAAIDNLLDKLIEQIKTLREDDPPERLLHASLRAEEWREILIEIRDLRSLEKTHTQAIRNPSDGTLILVTKCPRCKNVFVSLCDGVTEGKLP